MTKEQNTIVVKNAHNENERIQWLLESLNHSQRIAKIGSWDWDLRSNRVWWSDETYKIFDVPPDDYIPSFESNGEFVHPDDLQMYGEVFDHTLKTGAPIDCDIRLISKSGLLKYCHVKGTIFRDAPDQAAHCIGTISDITDRKLTELALQESEERFRNVAALSPDIISIINSEGKLIFNSSAAQSIHGYTQDDLIGQNTFDLIHPEDQEQVSRVFSDLLNNPLQTRFVRYRYKNKDGSYAWMECSAINQLANPLVRGVIAISRNIDEQKRLEEERNQLERQLLYAQKVESLSILAGGIAHDFNNILMAIVGNVDMALRDLNKNSHAVKNLYRIEQAAARAAELVKQMLAYSGKGQFVIENLSLNRLIEEMLQMLELSISKKIKLSLNLSPSLPLVEADATQLRQILMNIVINAAEAIGDRSGVLAITTGRMEYDRDNSNDFLLCENLKEGAYAYLEVTDTGWGMDQETLSKMFDPFFSTKFTGRGMGLASVLGIVRGHNGGIKVESEPGKGTTFKIVFPASRKSAEMGENAPCRDEWQGSGIALLVDDEEFMRDIGSEMLKAIGFIPITASNGIEAVELLKYIPDITCVILDLIMPEMDGAECFRRLKKIRPDIKVVVSSGCSENEVAQKFEGQGITGCVAKPYNLSALREMLSKIM